MAFLRAMIRFLSVLLLLWMVTDSQAADPPAPAKAVSLAKCAAPPVIDGVLGEAEWQCAQRLVLSYQVLPGDNVNPSERTEVFISYDTQHLYLAFHAFDRAPEAIRARMARRDNVFEDDYVAVFLDTFNDRRRAYALYCNPFGVGRWHFHSGESDGAAAAAGHLPQSHDLSIQSRTFVSFVAGLRHGAATVRGKPAVCV